MEHPNPELLQWDLVGTAKMRTSSGVVNRSVYNGWLKVPLVHDPALLDFEEPPSVCLRVRALGALKQPAKNGPLLAHCGGPGTGRDCAMKMSVANLDIDGQHSIISSFDLLSIDQRGVNSSADRYESKKRWGVAPPCPFRQSGHEVKPFPTMFCDELKRYAHQPQELLQMMAPVDAAEVPELWKTYVEPIWKHGRIPFTDLAPMNEPLAKLRSF